MNDHLLDRDEPIFADPNALLRRMVRDGSLADGALLDPWGGTISFLRSNGPRVPFLSVRGFTLHAPGPDGAAGTADDVSDPFARVLKSGTPYAVALGEDRIVDAKWDMKVAESTVTAWESLLEELTGTKLGGVREGIGLGGYRHRWTWGRRRRSRSRTAAPTATASIPASLIGRRQSAPIRVDMSSSRFRSVTSRRRGGSPWSEFPMERPQRRQPSTFRSSCRCRCKSKAARAGWKEIGWTSGSSCRTALTRRCERRSPPVQPVQPL